MNPLTEISVIKYQIQKLSNKNNKWYNLKQKYNRLIDAQLSNREVRLVCKARTRIVKRTYTIKETNEQN